MKHIPLLLFAMLLLASCSPRLDSPDRLGDTLYRAFRTGDEGLWRHCLLQEEDIAWLDTRIRLANDENPPDYAPLVDLTDELPVRYAEAYAAILAESEGFGWNTSTLERVETGEEIEASWVPPGVRLYDSLTLTVRSGEAMLNLRFYDIVKTERGWLVSNSIHRLQKETR